jgi:hypothetical protein
VCITNIQRLFILNTQLINPADVDGVLLLTLKGLEEFAEFLVDVAEGLVLLDPLVQFTLDLLHVEESVLVNLLILVVIIVVDHPTLLLHLELEL